MINLADNIQYIKGVGPVKAQLLNKLGIYNVYDLITYFPREYEDRGNIKNIIDINDGETCSFRATVVSKVSEIKVRKGLTIYKLIVRDETANALITWYNQAYLKNKFTIGQSYTFFGKVSKKNGKVEVQSPIFDEEDKNQNTGKIIPLYPLTYNLSQNTIRIIIENAIKTLENSIEESLPNDIIEINKLCDINYAIKQIHFPDNLECFEKARFRLVFEELLLMQLALLSLKNNYTKENKGIKFDNNVKMLDIITELPFKLTKAQLKVLEEIDSNMESETPMNRLLQGDVGSRKNSSINY